jgi:hypothetical protein
VTRADLLRERSHVCDEDNPLRAALLEQEIAKNENDASASGRPARTRSSSDRADTARPDVYQTNT